jgi:transposase-like protein
MPPIRPELLDELLKDYQQPEDLLGQDGLLQQLIKALVERALDGELTHHLGYERHDSAGDKSGNSRPNRIVSRRLAAFLPRLVSGQSTLPSVTLKLHLWQQPLAAAGDNGVEV